MQPNRLRLDCPSLLIGLLSSCALLFVANAGMTLSPPSNKAFYNGSTAQSLRRYQAANAVLLPAFTDSTSAVVSYDAEHTHRTSKAM